LFVALHPPTEILRELLAVTEDLRGTGLGSVRWTRPELLHLTLAFLGEVDDATHAELAVRLARAATRTAPLRLSLGSAGRFGDRVLWTRVRGDVTGLRRLADSVRASARRVRLPVEDRPYRPHVTLARAQGGAELRSAVDALAGFESSSWTADQLELVSSQLGAGPDRSSRYETVAAWPLTGRPGGTRS
jgi:2'-5' RNA ligase